jgi:hypothetical protein
MIAVKITHLRPEPADAMGFTWSLPLTTRSPNDSIPSPRANAALGEALVRAYQRVSQSGRALVSRVVITPLADYPERGVLPDPDMMATLVVPVRSLPATAFVSFPPEQALELIPVWCEGSLRGDQALGCYRRGTRALAEAGLAVFGLEASDADALEEDALVATLLATHAPPDTAILSAELQIELGERNCTGVFALLADPKVTGSLA